MFIQKRTASICILPILSLLLMGYSCHDELDTESASFFKNISTEESEKLIHQYGDSSNFVVLDVSNPGEYNSGHIARAVQIDYFADDFKIRLERLDKEKTYLVYCRTGYRSDRAVKMMQEMGFQKVYNMIGGFKQWTAEMRPIIETE